MQKWVRYVDIILLITALIVLLIDFQTKQDILRATREFYDAKRQAEGYQGRHNTDNNLPGGVLYSVPDDSESVEDAKLLEYSVAEDNAGGQEIVFAGADNSDPYARSVNQGIPGKRQQVGA